MQRREFTQLLSALAVAPGQAEVALKVNPKHPGALRLKADVRLAEADSASAEKLLLVAKAVNLAHVGGKAHVVIVGDDGVIRWNDKEWRSLSEVARSITGTRWSGPAFFGLKRKVAA